MNRFFYLVLLAGGLVLIAYGMDASGSVSSNFSQFFTGSPSNKAISLVVGGAVVAAMGAAGFLRGSSVI
jgi:hypothetical protein